MRSPDDPPVKPGEERNPGTGAPDFARQEPGSIRATVMAAVMRSPDEGRRKPTAIRELRFPDYAALRQAQDRSIRATIVAEARSWIGTPYRHQAALKGVGCDCLGLLIGVWRAITGEDAGPLPPYTPDWAEAMGRETFAEGLRRHLDEIDPGAARAGDIVLFRWRAHLPAKHAGILTAPGRMVHAQERAAVAEVPLSAWWRRRMAFGFAFPRASRSC